MSNPLSRVRERMKKRLSAYRYNRRGRRYLKKGQQESAAVCFARTCDGWFSADELGLFYRTIRSLEGPGNLAEIGSWKGRSTAVGTMALRDAGVSTDVRYISIDPHTGSEEHTETIARIGTTLDDFRDNLKRLKLYDYIDEMVQFSFEAAENLLERKELLRFVHIDGAHDFENVSRDIRCFLPMVRIGGIIALHDFDPEGGPWPEVWQAFQAELEPYVDIIDHIDSLYITRVKSHPEAPKA
jgi:predicted O-methyltransferase YrrM